MDERSASLTFITTEGRKTGRKKKKEGEGGIQPRSRRSGRGEINEKEKAVIFISLSNCPSA